MYFPGKSTTINRLKLLLAGIIMFSFLSSCFNMFNPEKPKTNEEKRDISTVRNYAVYYGQNRKEDLEKFDMVIIQPHTFIEKEDVEYLQNKGVKVIAYMSIGEADMSDDFYKDLVDESWLLGQNPNWPTSYYANVNDTGWQNFIINTMVPKILLKDFDGLFLDTVDTVQVHEQTTTGMVELIKKIRDVCPDKTIIQNRGFQIFEHTDIYVDGILYETFTKSDGRVLDAVTAGDVQSIALAEGVTVFTLDYLGSHSAWHEIPENDTTAIEECITSAGKFNFIPYISTSSLQDIYTLTFDKITWR